MNRDGSSVSLWQANTPVYIPVNAWEKDRTYDVLIIGGGITGITAALLLQEAGKKCILAEAHTLGFGTTGGTTAHLNTLLDFPYYQVEKDFGAEAAQNLATGAREAIDLVEGLISKYSIDCGFEYRSGYLFSTNNNEDQELERIKDGCNNAGVMAEWATAIPAPFKFTRAMKVNFQAQLQPLSYISGLARAFEQLGGVILQHCLVSNVNGDDLSIQADSSLGAIHAREAIYATHIPPGINIFSFRCAPYRSYALACTLESNDAYPDGLVYDSEAPYHYYRTQVIDGQKYLVAGGCDHKTGHNNNQEHVYTELEAHIRQHFPVATVAYRWSSQYYEPVDGLPYIGLMPGHENIYVATGFGGNGITLGSLAAKIICCMITKTVTRYDDLFDPGRIKLVAGFRQFVTENADVISKFISGKFSYEKITALVELAPGQAAIAEWEGHKVALYKDSRGHIFAVDPVCPHARCNVAWNSAEQSWDCPCHGSRFAPNGDLLTGPATKGLPQIKWEDIEGD